jgi:hypothetical protein
MNKDNAPEKLIIVPEEINRILLKHLMILKNENAYLKNNAAIQSSENSITEKSNGIESALYPIDEKSNGTKSAPYPVAEKGNGTKPASYLIAEKDSGTPSVGGSIAEKSNGTKSVLYAIAEKDNGTNSENWLSSVFEECLVDALNQFVNNGDGQHTLYSFYSDFVEAVAEKNLSNEKIKQDAVVLPLSETHTLPASLPVDIASILKLKPALRSYFPNNTRHDFYKMVASELLFLHNAGKATGLQLRQASGLSKPGFAKHKPKLHELGFIVKVPPSKYALTDLSKDILLRTFGVPKDK